MNKKQRIAVHEKYGGRCAYCGNFIEYEQMQVDHRVSIRDGGTDDFDNLEPSCRRCNHYKRARPIEIFRQYLLDMERKVLGTYLGKVARDYGMVHWNGWDGVFYFERFEKAVRHNENI